jgi:hypothetical protein
MTKIALAAAAILVAMGNAFAGSDHYGSDGVNQPAAPVAGSVSNIDNSFTASIRKSDPARHNGVDTMMMTGPGQTILDIIARHNSDGIWGR